MKRKKIDHIVWLKDVGSKDLSLVGGKNASLGEMLQAFSHKGVNIPDGFATTSDAFFEFLSINNLNKDIKDLLDQLKKGKLSLPNCGKRIRNQIEKASFSETFIEQITEFYEALSKKYEKKNIDVAVRSSATAEDLPGASFAGQQETYLHIQTIPTLIDACRKCYASLYTDRAIAYRIEKGFDKKKIALSVCVQKMVRSDKASSGIMFTLDPDSGFQKVIKIDATWGLGETIVQGIITPDEYLLFKPHLCDRKGYPILEKTLGSKKKKMIYSSEGKTKTIPTTHKERKSYVLMDEELELLAHWGMIIEDHFQSPMDIEWAKDGLTGEIFILQARPETVQSQKKGTFVSYRLKEKAKPICSGLAIGDAITHGEIQVIESVKQISSFISGSVLVTTMTSPDWVPIMKKAKGIITEQGGRTSHAAIVSRELGIPAIVGTDDAIRRLKNEKMITLSCAEGEKGFVYRGQLDYEEKEIPIMESLSLPVDLMLNIASPSEAYRWWRLPTKGIGLARMEFIISNIVQIHPMALIHFEKIEDKKTKKTIEKLTKDYPIKSDYFVAKLSKNIAKIASSQYPDPVIVRMSDFKTNEYANLIGGKYFEAKEENPMLGFRGASRYYHESYLEGFALECQAIKVVREFWGFKNVIIMIPFCRTVDEVIKVHKALKKNGLERGKKNLQVYMMAEIPSNVILAKEFATYFDGFSIGSNDLTQLVLGIDRDSEILSPLFDEKNSAVKKAIQEIITKAHAKKIKVGICGEAPSTYPEFAKFLIEENIDSISLSPTSVMKVIQHIKK